MMEPIDRSQKYNLNVVLLETGVKADTLRAWERRYQLPQPGRTAGGHRLFSQYDIETIKWLLARQEEGMSIGRAAALWHEIMAGGADPLAPQVRGLVQEPTIEEVPGGRERLAQMRGEWLRACIAYDEESAEQVMGEAFALFPMERVCLDLLAPGLAEMGELWYLGKATVQQEHFASELAVRRLHALVAAAPSPVQRQFITVACPPREQHTFPALFFTLMLRYRGWPVVYLGANVPAAHLEDTIREINPSLVVQSATRLNTAAALLESSEIIEKLGSRFAFGGGVFSQIPNLAERIPGHFLGNTLHEAAKKIENLLREPAPTKAIKITLPDHSALIEHTLSSLGMIEAKVLQDVRSKYGAVIADENLTEANEFFRDDMLAALKLGDLSLVEHNLGWLVGLMGRQTYSREALEAYLIAYSEAVREQLGDEGQMITNWLENISVRIDLHSGDNR